MATPQQPAGVADPASLRTLLRGVHLFRLIALGWMTAMAIVNRLVLVRPVLAWGAIAGAALWTAWVLWRAGPPPRALLAVDLAVSVALVTISAFVVPEGSLAGGRPFFAMAYPMTAPLMWGVVAGPVAGLSSGLLVGAAMVATRPLNGSALTALSADQMQHLGASVVNYAVAGLAVGLVARLLRRSAQAYHAANAELVVERERAARLQEREKMARQIHDSVLQVLSLVHKRGRELAGSAHPDPAALIELADLAGTQEAELRSLILRPAAEPAGRTVSLRDGLEAAARGSGLPVTTSFVGPLQLDQDRVREIVAAIRQGFDNIEQHARAQRVWLFAESDGSTVCVTLRDDGVGFEFDEAALVRSGRAGLLRSIKGRAEDLGGEMSINTSKGNGTEIELKIPVEDDPDE